jgi:hypothetical protein
MDVSKAGFLHRLLSQEGIDINVTLTPRKEYLPGTAEIVQSIAKACLRQISHFTTEVIEEKIPPMKTRLSEPPPNNNRPEPTKTTVTPDANNKAKGAVQKKRTRKSPVKDGSSTPSPRPTPPSAFTEVINERLRVLGLPKSHRSGSQCVKSAPLVRSLNTLWTYSARKQEILGTTPKHSAPRAVINFHKPQLCLLCSDTSKYLDEDTIPDEKLLLLLFHAHHLMGERMSYQGNLDQFMESKEKVTLLYRGKQFGAVPLAQYMEGVVMEGAAAWPMPGEVPQREGH